MVGFRLVSETEAVWYSVKVSEAKRFVGRKGFLKEVTSCRTTSAPFSGPSTWKTSCQKSGTLPEFAGSYFSCKRGHRSTRSQRYRKPYSRRFHKKFLVYRSRELFDELEVGIKRRANLGDPATVCAHKPEDSDQFFRLEL